MVTFRYLRDPLFLASLAAYVVNRWMVKPWCDVSFFYNHFNDLICLPLFVPLILLVARKLKLRRHDEPPHPLEILLPLLVWSIMFEILLPQHPYWSQWIIGDPFDVLWYSIGGCLSSFWWQFAYGTRLAFAP